MADEAQQLRGGRYVVTRALGAGSQGDTLEAVDKQAGRLVAIKRFQVRGAKRWKDVELAEREARVLESLSHPGLPGHVEHFEEGGALYLVMEKIEGESLAALRRRGAVLGRADIVRLLRESSAILDYLHGRAPPVVHRDVKPGNVIRRPDGSFALIDFGAVRDRMRPEGGSTVVGTFGYMAPEQFQGRAQPSSDVYALGATALAMLTGLEPEDMPHQGLAIDVAAALRGRGDPALVEVLSAMLQPDPDRRPGAVGPLLARLDAGKPPERPRAQADPGKREGREGVRGRRREEREERREKRESRKAQKHAWKDERHRRPPFGLSGLPLAFVLMGLQIARVAVALTLGLFVPMVLTVLSIVFGRRLRDAARRVRETGHEADGSLAYARSVVRGTAAGPSSGGVRVAEEAQDDERVRFGVDDPPAQDRERERHERADAEAAAEAEAAEAERRRGKRAKR
jgi:hypothetical protein